MRRTIVIGDIHGCYDELLQLLEKISFDTNDRVVAVGDLIVKGEKNRQVIELFSTDNRFSSVVGNHDRALCRYWRGEAVSLRATQDKARMELEDGKERYLQYLCSLPSMIDLGAHLVVHAGVRPSLPVKEQSIEDLTELRTLGEDRTSREGTPWYDVYNGEKTILFGHWPAREVRRAQRAIGLDTGCVYGHRLTAYIVETGDIVSVKAHRVYDFPKQGLR